LVVDPAKPEKMATMIAASAVYSQPALAEIIGVNAAAR
jgi:hypothetical protein